MHFSSFQSYNKTVAVKLASRHGLALFNLGLKGCIYKVKGFKLSHKTKFNKSNIKMKVTTAIQNILEKISGRL